MAKGKGGFIGQDGLNAPDAPTGVSGTAGDTQVTVSWTAPSDVGGSAITGYNVQTGSGLGPDSMVQEVDLGNGSYDSKEYTVARNDISMKADGTKWIGKTLAGVFYSYSMSTAFDITTSSQTSTIDLGSDTGSSAQGLHVKPDGTKFYVIDLTNTRVLQFAMSTAWDVSTASYESKLFSVSSQESSPRDVTFSEDGTKMYVVGTGSDAVFQYTLSTAWDVSTASYDSKSLDVSSEDSAPIGLDISRNGKNLVVGGAAGNDVNQYNLSTAFDVSTGSYDSTLATMSNGYFPALAGETDETTKMYVTSNSTIRQYSVGGSIPTITSSPFTFTGLTNGTSYTFNVWAINAFGYSAPSDASDAVSPAALYAMWAGGEDSSAFNTIDFVSFTTIANATDWGDLTSAREAYSGASNANRAVFAGGGTNVLDYITWSSTGNAVDFGDMLGNTSKNSALASDTRGVYAGGNSGGRQNVMQYITIASAGNATDFGDLAAANQNNAACASTTRGVIGGGDEGSRTDRIQYITIASTGNTTDFGNLSSATNALGSASNATRGLYQFGYAGGTPSNTIEYITIASTGNTTDFGNLSYTGGYGNQNASSTRCITRNGRNSGGSAISAVEYVEIATTGNASDWGNLTVSRYAEAAVSNCHGGLS